MARGAGPVPRHTRRPGAPRSGPGSSGTQQCVSSRATEATREHRAFQPRLAPRAPVMEDVEGRPDPAPDQVGGPPDDDHLAVGQPGQLRDGQPARPCRGVRPDLEPGEQRIDRDEWSGVVGVGCRLDLDRRHLGSGLVDRALDGELERHRRRRATVAAAQKPQSDHALLADLEQLDVTSVGTQIGADALQRALDSLLDAVRMKPVHGQQPRHAARRRPGPRAARRRAGRSRGRSPECARCPVPYRSATSRTSSSARSRATVPPDALAFSRVSMRSPVTLRSAASSGSSGTMIVPGYSAPTDCVGECVRSRTCPSPRYMWTPHGRHGIEAAHRAHDVDALEVFAVVLLEDRLPLHRVLVGTGRSVGVPRVAFHGVGG